jgi:predicted permease
MHETLRGFRFWSDPRATLGFVLVRLLFAPLVVLLAASFITDDNLRRVMLVQAAMPAGIFTFLIVGHCKGDVPLALRGTIVTSILCPLTIPVWIEIGRRWLGIYNL